MCLYNTILKTVDTYSNAYYLYSCKIWKIQTNKYVEGNTVDL